MDCDASLDPAELPRVVAGIDDGSADLVLGARQAEPARGPSTLGWPTAGWLAACGAATATRSPISGRCGRPAAMVCSVSGWSIADRVGPWRWCLRAGNAGWRVQEVPVTYRARTGRSKVTGTVGGTLRAVGDMRRQLAELT